MGCATWLNRGTALGLLIGALLGVGGASAWFMQRDRSREVTTHKPAETPLAPLHPPPKPADPNDTIKEKAQKQCRALATGVEAYSTSASNPGLTDEERLPHEATDLVQPPFGGPSFLANGKVDLNDPWGKQYKFSRAQRQDGSLDIIVSTTAPDGTRISQFGIGENSRPR